MKHKLRYIIYVILPLIFFSYGLAVGVYKLFPVPQILAIKHYVEQSTGTFENQPNIDNPDSVVVFNTFFQRLLIKKVRIPKFSSTGGGMSISGNYLYIITNKGSVQSFNLDTYKSVENNISDIPMNFRELIRAGHTYKNNFRIQWFRVNGFYSEQINNTSHILYVSHNAYNDNEDCITQNISRIELNITKQDIIQKNNWKTIFTASPCLEPVPEGMSSIGPYYPGHISGGIIINYKNNKLLVSIGDYNRNGINGIDEYPMDSANPYGKIILVDKKTGDWSVFTSGSRNTSGMYIDRDSVIWAVENGPMGGDELNILEKNKNYGWPKVSYGLWYDPTLRLPGGFNAGTYPKYTKPVYSWVPSVAPRGLTKVEGTKFNYWKGDLLMGTMRDQSLHRLRLDEDNNVVYDERIHLGHRIRDLTTLPDGKIGIITDDGYLIIIEDGGPIFQEINSSIKKRLSALNKFDGFNFNIDNHETEFYTSKSEEIFQRNCSTCHNLDTSNQIGPHLSNLFNRKVGNIKDYNYSQILRTDDRKWNSNLLRTYLKDPQAVFPGTQMQKINLSSEEIDSLINFFQNQN